MLPLTALFLAYFNMKEREMEKSNASLIEQLSANALLNSFTFDQIVHLIKEIERQAASMDVTTPLYKYFKSVMEREDTQGL